MSHMKVKSILSWSAILFLISVAAVAVASWIINVDSFTGGHVQANRTCKLPKSDPCQLVISGNRHVRT
jgi:hypothetical protein